MEQLSLGGDEDFDEFENGVTESRDVVGEESSGRVARAGFSEWIANFIGVLAKLSGEISPVCFT
jgi:hypothetical protein